MTEEEFQQFNRWHLLFDELCNRAGFHDASSLAARYCELAGNRDQKEHETTLRNLNNWRSGRHIPRIRSLRMLERVLGVNEDPALLAHWNALYRQANETGEDTPAEIQRPARRSAVSLMPGTKAAAAAAFAFCVGIAIGGAWGAGWRPWGNPADDAPLVVYKPEIFMSVGESKVIHAERGSCGELPRDWKDVAAYLPPTALGSFSDGGLAQRNSVFCKGLTPARAIMFTATKPGVEEITLQGDFLKVTIAEAKQP